VKPTLVAKQYHETCCYCHYYHTWLADVLPLHSSAFSFSIQQFCFYDSLHSFAAQSGADQVVVRATLTTSGQYELLLYSLPWVTATLDYVTQMGLQPRRLRRCSGDGKKPSSFAKQSRSIAFSAASCAASQRGLPPQISPLSRVILHT